VRRLCSEGTRPLLPWSRRLETPPDYAIDLISRLHADPTRFVTRSVANHVNDLSKLDADLALALLQDWLDAGHQEARESWTTWFAMPCERS
jgi:3-methyladenine DNA glycosylase AlkC